MLKDSDLLVFTKGDDLSLIINDEFPKTNKITLWAYQSTVIPTDHLVNVVVTSTDNDFSGEVFIETSVTIKENNEYCISSIAIAIKPILLYLL